MNRQGRNIWSCVKKVCNAERIRKKGWRPIDGRVIHRVLCRAIHRMLRRAIHRMLSHSIHEGLAPNKSKIKNSWKCINALRLFFILSLLGL